MMKNLDDEKILIPVKYPEYSDNLVTMATLMRNPTFETRVSGIEMWYMMT